MQTKKLNKNTTTNTLRLITPLTPEITPLERSDKKNYVPNDHILNTYNKLGNKSKIEYNVHSNTGVFQPNHNGVIIEFKNYNKNKNFKYPQKAYRFLLYILNKKYKLIKSKNPSNKSWNILDFPVIELMRATQPGVKDTKSNRRNFKEIVNESLAYLSSSYIDLTKYENIAKKSTEKVYFHTINLIAEAKATYGTIHVEFTNNYMKYLIKNVSTMELPMEAFGLSDEAFSLIHKIYFQKKMEGKKNNYKGNIKYIKLGVETLLENIGNISKYEDLKHKRVKEKIIEPFKKYMNEIIWSTGTGINNWVFCKKDGGQISEEDFRKYEKFKNLQITIIFGNQQTIELQ
jgi:hypothetical protein